MTEKIPKTCYLEPKLVEIYNKIEEKKPTLSELLNIALAAYLQEVSDEERLCLKLLSFNNKIKAMLDTHNINGDASA